VKPGNSDNVKHLLSQGADPNFKGDKSRTPLHRAAIFGCDDQLDMLFAADGSLDTRDEDGETPLHIAAREGHLQAVKQLVALGANINASSDYGAPLDRAALRGHTEVIRFLLEHGAIAASQRYWGRTPLHEAARMGHTDAVKLLLDHGSPVDSIDRYGNDRTPLHAAIFPGAKEVVRLLLKYGANINHRNNWGATPLHMAARINAVDVAAVLLEYGADCNVTDKDGRTPLDEAKARARYSATDRLIQLLTAAGENDSYRHGLPKGIT